MEQQPLLLPELQAGLPLFDPGARTARITRCWYEVWPSRPPGDQPTCRVSVRLLDPDSRFPYPSPSLHVIWLGVVASTSYIVLELTPFDLDDGFTQVVARLLPASTAPSDIVEEQVLPDGSVRLDVVKTMQPALVESLSQAELAQIEPLLRASAEQTSLPSLDELERLLGPIPERGSPEYYAACFEEHHLALGWAEIAGHVLDGGCSATVLAVEQAGPGELQISLGPPFRGGTATPIRGADQAAEPERFEVCAQTRASLAYVVVRSLGDEQADPRRWAYLLRVGDGEVATPSGRAEAERVARGLIDQIERRASGDMFPMLRLMPWDDVESLVQRLRKPISAFPPSAFPVPETAMPAPDPAPTPVDGQPGTDREIVRRTCELVLLMVKAEHGWPPKDGLTFAIHDAGMRFRVHTDPPEPLPEQTVRIWFGLTYDGPFGRWHGTADLAWTLTSLEPDRPEAAAPFPSGS